MPCELALTRVLSTSLLLLLVLASAFMQATAADNRPSPSVLWPNPPPLPEPLYLSHQAGNDADTLRAAAQKRGIYVGAAANYYGLTDKSDLNYTAVFQREYSLSTAENSCKWTTTEPSMNSYDLMQCLYIRNVTLQTKAVFRGHNLAWGVYNPAWLTNHTFSSDELRDLLEWHIGNVTQGLSTDTYCWDVVNEAVSDNPSEFLKPADPWYPAIQDYVQFAFAQASQLAPKGVKLFYNDYGAEALQQKSDKVYKLVSDMLNAGIQVDGVGLQMHVSLSHYPDLNNVSANIARLGKLGLEVHITEMDVECPDPCDQDALKKQASIYGGLLTACLANHNCKNFETWGFTDKRTWRTTANHPLPFDEDYQKKPAYFEMLSVLNNPILAMTHYLGSHVTV